MKRKTFLFLFSIIMAATLNNNLFAQNNDQYIRIARLVIDSSKLDDYKQALKEHAEAAVKLEPGVIMLYAVYEKQQPTHVSVFEIYADENAYKLHIQAPHFLKYKATVQNMVKSLQLVDVSPIALEAKPSKAN